MSEKKNHMKDEELEKVSGGSMTMEDEEWVRNIIIEALDNGDSWNDVCEKYFREIEPYCERVNKTRPNTLHVFPRDIEDNMMYQYFELGKTYIPKWMRE